MLTYRKNNFLAKHLSQGEGHCTSEKNHLSLYVCIFLGVLALEDPSQQSS